MKLMFKNKCIGSIEDKVFRKTVKKSKHLYRQLNAWGIDNEAFNNHILPFCETIEVYESEGKKTYTTTVDNFEKNSIYRSNKDYGLQRFLPLSKWQVK